MLALATLATGFVVAAVTPSHGADHTPVADPGVSGTLDSADHPAGPDGPAAENHTPGHE
ncbi:hypothetical protein J2Z21_006897 [Streptomyces griseochromogenes]|nr:hypothetical protein [Streptomyces griseochromogenes]